MVFRHANVDPCGHELLLGRRHAHHSSQGDEFNSLACDGMHRVSKARSGALCSYLSLSPLAFLCLLLLLAGSGHSLCAAFL